MSFSLNEKVLIAILALVQFVHIVDFMIIMPLAPQLMPLLQINTQQFGWIVSAYTFSAGVSGFLAAFFMDRFDRKKSLVILFLGFCLATLGCGWAPSYLELLLARVVTGFFGGILSSLVFSIVSDAINYERRGTAMGLIMSAFSLASVLGVPFSLWLANYSNWNAPFFALGFLSLLILVLIFFKVPNFRSHLNDIKISPWVRMGQLTKPITHQKSLLFMGVMTLGHFLVIPFISPSMVANVGFSIEQLPLIYLMGGLASMITGPLIGVLSDKYGKHFIFMVSGSLVLIPILWITQMSQTPLLIVLGVIAFFFALSGGRMIPATTMVSQSVDPMLRGGFMSLVSSVQNLAAGFASLVSGHIVYQELDGHLSNYQYVGYLSVLFGLIALGLGKTLKVTKA